MRSPIFGRRIHIAGSVPDNVEHATEIESLRARKFVALLVKELLKKGATFVVPVDAEKKRQDGTPICFDWLVWQTIKENMHLRPHGAPTPVAIAVKHHKNQEQIPPEFQDLWDEFSISDSVRTESAAHWNMNSKRMEAQARHGDVLVTVGGGEGILFLANEYHDQGKPVVPVDFRISVPGSGTHRLVEYSQTGNNAARFFKTTDGNTSLTWIERLIPNSRNQPQQILDRVTELMGVLVPPTAFAVRLLNPKSPDYADVQNFFDTVVKPVIEDEYGYSLVVVDGAQAVEHSRIDQEIFAKLRRSRLVIADITGVRPNCFIELGYALGRAVPTIATAREGTETPFDVMSYAAHHWKTTGSVDERRREFRTHFEAVKNRPPLVHDDPLIP